MCGFAGMRSICLGHETMIDAKDQEWFGQQNSPATGKILLFLAF
jgi:hypothetical protein